jgi:hypothetical protein
VGSLCYRLSFQNHTVQGSEIDNESILKSGDNLLPAPSGRSKPDPEKRAGFPGGPISPALLQYLHCPSHAKCVHYRAPLTLKFSNELDFATFEENQLFSYPESAGIAREIGVTKVLKICVLNTRLRWKKGLFYHSFWLNKTVIGSCSLIIGQKKVQFLVRLPC